MSLISLKNGFTLPPDRRMWEVFSSSHIDPLLSGVRNFPSESKIILFLLIWLVLWLPIAFLLGRKLNWQPFQPLKPEQKIPLLVPLYLLVPWLGGLTLVIEGSPLFSYGLSWGWNLLISLGTGLVLGVGGLGLVFLLEGSLGWLKWRSENLRQLGKVALPILGLAMWIALTEEFVFRGMFQTLLEEDYNQWVSAIVISGIFALVHLLWERQSTIPQLPGLWLMGMVLVIARWVDGGSLGLAWGLHAGWVWGLASLDTAKMIVYTGQGKDWMVGVYQQPLAGIMGIFCLFATGCILWLWPLMIT
ncbi:MAG: lysostaphin resistance A-like protein [Crocosphaera sp.]